MARENVAEISAGVNYRVVINAIKDGKEQAVTVAEFRDFGEAVNLGWRLCHKDCVPAGQIDILRQTVSGEWVSIWADFPVIENTQPAEIEFEEGCI